MKKYKFESATLQRGIRAILPHVAKPSDYVPILEHVRIFSDGTGLVLEASDRYRLGRARVELLDDAAPEPLDVLVRADALKALALQLKASKARVGTLITDGDTVSAELADLTIWSERLDADLVSQWPSLGKLLAKAVDGARDLETATPGFRFNPELLTGITAGLKAAAGAKAWRESGVNIYRAGGTDSAQLVLTFEDWYVGVMMPMRGPGGAPITDALPEVAGLAQAEPVATQS